MSKIPYWKHGYGTLICSECGYVISEEDDMKRYLDYRKNRKICPACKVDMREPLKRCYYKDNFPGDFNPCGETIYQNGVEYCYKLTKERMEELKSWGYYYKCRYMNPPESENKQLTFY